jgi:hypothetical protein
VELVARKGKGSHGRLHVGRRDRGSVPACSRKARNRTLNSQARNAPCLSPDLTTSRWMNVPDGGRHRRRDPAGGRGRCPRLPAGGSRRLHRGPARPAEGEPQARRRPGCPAAPGRRQAGPLSSYARRRRDPGRTRPAHRPRSEGRPPPARSRSPQPHRPCRGRARRTRPPPGRQRRNRGLKGARVLGILGETGDPNGIRTRVAALKGRCPRPLDDGVVEGADDLAAPPWDCKHIP